MANLTLAKVRYWDIRRYELNGTLNDAALNELTALTPQKIGEMIDKADAVLTSGRGPRYRNAAPTNAASVKQ